MKLLCKRIELTLPGFTSGKYYLAKIDGQDFVKLKFYPQKLRVVKVEDNDGYEWYFIYVTPHTLYIWDYFYTPQEERKMKLEKIDNLV